MLAKFETLLQANAGLSTVNVDGQVVQFSDLQNQWRFWRNEVAKESGTRNRFNAIDLSGAAATAAEEGDE